MKSRIIYLLFLICNVRISYCDDITKWSTSLRALIKDCPSASWNDVERIDIFDALRYCMQHRALSALDAFLSEDVVPIFDGLDLVRLGENEINSTDQSFESDAEINNIREGITTWKRVILNRITRIFDTHVIKLDVAALSNAIGKGEHVPAHDKNHNVIQSRRRRHRRRNQMMPMLLMGFLLMGSILIPMGFQFLAVLGGKALLLAKMALMLSSIQGLKKIATNGVNYGLYHSPVPEHWHERSNLENEGLHDHVPPPYPDFPPQYHH